jgi:ABC-type phosphate transport system substrate-binding protein
LIAILFDLFQFNIAPHNLQKGDNDHGLSIYLHPDNPTDECVRENKYPIARYLYFYTIKKPEGVVKLFIDWALSEEGQRIVKEINYIPPFEVSWP